MGKTIAEKIFDAHRVDELAGGFHVLRIDAVFCHEITTPIAINDLVSRGKDRVFDPSKIKVVIDHVTPAKDTKTAQQGKILRDWARRQGIKDFFDIGRNGVCHAIFPEQGFSGRGTPSSWAIRIPAPMALSARSRPGSGPPTSRSVSSRESARSRRRLR